MKVYVDTGGMLKEVAELEASGLITTHHFPFEQRSRKVTNFVPGSASTWEQAHLSWAEDTGSWDDDSPTTNFEPLRKLIGKRVDAQHLDSAIKAGCSIFITSDKTDIWSKREAIEAMTGIRVLHMPTELEALRRLAGSPPRKSP